MKKIIASLLALFVLSFCSISLGATTKMPDLIINKIVLNANYATPQVGDKTVGFDFTIKNIGTKAITLAYNKHILLTCTDVNWTEILSDDLVYGSLWVNGSKTYKNIKTATDDTIDLFTNPQKFQIICKIKLKGIQELKTTNNTKRYIFRVIAKKVADLSVSKFRMEQWDCYNWQRVVTFYFTRSNIWQVTSSEYYTVAYQNWEMFNAGYASSWTIPALTIQTDIWYWWNFTWWAKIIKMDVIPVNHIPNGVNWQDALANYTNRSLDANQNNNSLTQTVTVDACP